jgi:hypothetical protein
VAVPRGRSAVSRGLSIVRDDLIGHNRIQQGRSAVSRGLSIVSASEFGVRGNKISITQKGGSFAGNESSGSFAVSKIVGEYAIANQVTVLIIDKPAIIPNSLIENEVKKFFGVK